VNIKRKSALLSQKSPRWRKNPPFNPMRAFSYFLAFASLASLALGCAFLLFSLPFPALLGFCGFASLGLAAVKLNPEI